MAECTVRTSPGASWPVGPVTAQGLALAPALWRNARVPYLDGVRRSVARCGGLEEARAHAHPRPVLPAPGAGRCRARAPRVPRHPDRRSGTHRSLVLRPTLEGLRPRGARRVGVLAAPRELPERGAVLPPAPGLEARARPARARRRPDLDGAQLLEPAPRVPGRPRGRREHAPPGRPLDRARLHSAGRSLAQRAVPVQHRRPLGPLRRRHDRGEGLPSARQGGLLRGRARGPPRDHGRAALPRGRDRHRGHPGSPRPTRRPRPLALALPRPLSDGGGLRVRQGDLRATPRTGAGPCGSSTA